MTPPPFLKAWLKPAHILTPRQIVRKSKQESARKGQSTYWSNAGKRARKVFEGVGG